MSFFDYFFSEEDREKMRAAHERQEMFREEFRHAFQRLFDELDEAQLTTVRTMLSALAHDENGAHLAAEWLGMATWAMRTRFNVCVTCGVNHDKELSEPSRPDEVLSQSTADSLEPDAFGVLQPDGTWNIFPEVRAELDKYHLDDGYEMQSDGTAKFLGFVCTGIDGAPGPCGTTYPSLADRKRRGPEECSGCFQRMMHG